MSQGPPVSDTELQSILEETKTIAIVGLSDNPMRPSHGVGRYLHDVGYKVIPVNPTIKEVFGVKAYPDLASLKQAGIQVDLVDVFRDPAHVVPIAQDAVKLGAKSIWFQEGVVNQEAAGVARKGGLAVVMDRCMMKDHARLIA